MITVSGDGSIMMNIQELATLRRYRLPLKIVLIDNAQLGMVRQWQELFFDENFSEIDLSDNPDFAEVARAFGIEAFTIDHRSEVEGAIARLLEHRRADPLPRPHRSARECVAAGAAEQLQRRDDGEGADERSASIVDFDAAEGAVAAHARPGRAARLRRRARIAMAERPAAAALARRSIVEPRDPGRRLEVARRASSAASHDVGHVTIDTCVIQDSAA